MPDTPPQDDTALQIAEEGVLKLLFVLLPFLQQRGHIARTDARNLQSAAKGKVPGQETPKKTSA